MQRKYQKENLLNLMFCVSFKGFTLHATGNTVSDESDLTVNLCKLEWNVRMAILVLIIQ